MAYLVITAELESEQPHGISCSLRSTPADVKKEIYHLARITLSLLTFDNTEYTLKPVRKEQNQITDPHRYALVMVVSTEWWQSPVTIQRNIEAQSKYRLKHDDLMVDGLVSGLNRKQRPRYEYIPSFVR